MLHINKQIRGLLIVLLFFARCKSPSQQIVEAFKTVDKSISKSNSHDNNSIDELYLSIDSNRKTNLGRALFADSVYLSAKNTCRYLDSLKDFLNSKDKTGDNLDLATNIFINSPTGDTLLKKLFTVYKYSYLPLLDKSKKGSLDSALAAIGELKVDKNWKELYFRQTPTVAAMTILNKFQNDCINATRITLLDIKNSM